MFVFSASVHKVSTLRKICVVYFGVQFKQNNFIELILSNIISNLFIYSRRRNAEENERREYPKQVPRFIAPGYWRLMKTDRRLERNLKEIYECHLIIELVLRNKQRKITL
jgi:hypothetical protein